MRKWNSVRLLAVAPPITALVWLLRAHAFLPACLGMLSLALVAASVFLGREREGTADSTCPQKRSLDGPDRKMRALIVGAGTVGRMLAQSLEAHNRYCVVGFIDDKSDTTLSGDWPILGQREGIVAIIRKYQIDEVFLAYAPTWQQQVVARLAVDYPHINVRVVPSPYEAVMRIGRVENLGEVAVVRLSESVDRTSDAIKRMLDIGIALVALVVTAPLMLAAALLIKFTSPGPVIFPQTRVGRGGKTFTLYKFRTMMQNAEAATGPVLSSGKNDSRLTPVGRWFRMFRIDEIPQLWNVLFGEMSIVGPRPERPVFVQQFEQMIPLYARRHEVRPGITGLAQVCAGYRTDARDKLRFDLIYVANRSPWLDIKIMLRTILVIFSSRGS